MAEIAAAPFVVRTLLALENNVGVWKEGEEKKVLEILEGGELERVWKWFDFLSRRESVKNTWDPVRGHSITRGVLSLLTSASLLLRSLRSAETRS